MNIYGILNGYNIETGTYIIEGISQNVDIENDSIVTTTGDLKEEYSIMGIIFSDGSLGDSTQDWEVELIKLKTKALAMKGHAIIYVKAISDGKYSRLMGTVVQFI